MKKIILMFAFVIFVLDAFTFMSPPQDEVSQMSDLDLRLVQMFPHEIQKIKELNSRGREDAALSLTAMTLTRFLAELKREKEELEKIVTHNVKAVDYFEKEERLDNLRTFIYQTELPLATILALQASSEIHAINTSGATARL